MPAHWVHTGLHDAARATKGEEGVQQGHTHPPTGLLSPGSKCTSIIEARKVYHHWACADIAGISTYSKIKVIKFWLLQWTASETACAGGLVQMATLGVVS